MTDIPAPKVSIIIPCRAITAYAEEAVRHCRDLDYPDYEIVVLPNEDVGAERVPGATVMPTGDIGPAEKRDFAAQRATGAILAFLDDDAYPRPDWLRNAVAHFEDPAVAAVGGPAVTPPSDPPRARAGGLVFESLLGGGPYAYRYVAGKRQDVDDYPSCNLLVRKADFDAVGGFDNRYWPGEDTVLCMALTKKLGKRIVYEPSALVYHHRRNLFGPHLKQVKSYALHRGLFARRFPATSRRPSYFLPSLFVLGLAAGPVVWFLPYLRTIWWTVTAIYLALVFATGVKAGAKTGPLVSLGVIATNVVYGLWFLRGFARPRLHERR